MTTTQSTSPRIVVGVDGSEPSRRALQWGAFLAAPFGATVDAVIAWQLPVATSGPRRNGIHAPR